MTLYPTSAVSTTLSTTQYPPSSTILRLSSNQDNRCFTIATTTGLIICTTDPFRQSISRHICNGIGISEMLNNSNILALVGGGPTPNCPLNKVIIWDDKQSRCLNVLCCPSKVISVRLRSDCIVVVLMRKIDIHSFSDLKLLHEIETEENPKGLCEISQSGASMVLACMGRSEGEVQVVDYPSGRIKVVNAHESSVGCIALTYNGTLIATASSKGTVIRVFNAWDGSLLHELRRGFRNAEIYSLSFCMNAQWLAASSDTGTVHVFSLKSTDSSGSLGIIGYISRFATEPNDPTQVSLLPLIKGFLHKCFTPERSVAQFHVPQGCNTLLLLAIQKTH